MKSLILNQSICEDKKTYFNTNDIKVFSSSQSELGEAPLWEAHSSSLLWLDILNKRLYQKYLNSDIEYYWTLPVTPSSIAIDSSEHDSVWLLTDTHLCRFDLTFYKLDFVFPLNLKAGYRTNDGGIGPDGRYWFGTMLWTPQPRNGQILSIGHSGDIRLEIENVAIPNTFCWTNDTHLLVSDSFAQQSFLWNKTNGDISLFLSKEGTHSTPDGGALDDKGNIWIAMWGEGKVVCYNQKGEVLDEILVPVKQPSSCCFGGKDLNTLFITTAREGLIDDGTQDFELSGKVFMVQLKSKGAVCNSFKGLKDDC